MTKKSAVTKTAPAPATTTRPSPPADKYYTPPAGLRLDPTTNELVPE